MSALGPAAPGVDPGRLLSPEDLLLLDEGAIDRLLSALEREVPAMPGLSELPNEPAQEIIAFGDTHGDWRSTRLAAERFLDAPARKFLVGLGDYVDRPPDDCAEGSVANALFLLELAARYPGRVLLIQGNHETVRQIPVAPEELLEEVDQLWGPDVGRYGRILGLLERGPFAVLAPGRAYLAHAGFPQHLTGTAARARFDRPDEEFLIDTVWRECAASRVRRGIGSPFTQRELAAFLDSLPAGVFIRGHDPDLTGRAVFGDRCLTLHTTRVFERFGGVVIARVPLDRPVRTAKDLRLEHLGTEGRTFPEPRHRAS